MTSRDRERSYLFGLLTGREAAKEVRAFGTARYLWDRYRRLYDQRLRELRRVERRATVYAVASGLGMGAVLAGGHAVGGRVADASGRSPARGLGHRGGRGGGGGRTDGVC